MNRSIPARRALPFAVVAVCALAVPAVASAENWQDIGPVAQDGGQGDLVLTGNGRGDLAAGFGFGLITRPAGGAWTIGSVPGELTEFDSTGLVPSAGATGVISRVLAVDGTQSLVQGGFAGGTSTVIPLPIPTAAPYDGAEPTPDVVGPARVVTDRSGRPVVVWRDRAGHIVTTTRVGAGWSPLRVLGPGRSASAALDRPVVGRDGTIVVLSSDGTGAVRSPQGTWRATTGSSPGIVGVDDQGAATVVQVGGLTRKVLYAARLAPGASTWEKRKLVARAPEGDDIEIGDVTADAHGTVVVGWWQGRSFRPTDTSIRFATRVGDGTWSRPVAVSATDAAVPKIGAVLDNRAQDVTTFVWRERRADGTDVIRARDRNGWDGTLSRFYDVPGLDDPVVTANAYYNPTLGATVTDAGDTVIAGRARGSIYEAAPPVNAVVEDSSGPAITDVSVPASPAPGRSGDFTVEATDAFSPLGKATWDFGDGTTGAGLTTTHAYAKAGTYTASVTVSDSHGNPTTATKTVVVGGATAPRAATDPGSGVAVTQIALAKGGWLGLHASRAGDLRVDVQRRVVGHVRRHGKRRRTIAYAPKLSLRVQAGGAGTIRAHLPTLHRGAGYRVRVSGPGVRPATTVLK